MITTGVDRVRRTLRVHMECNDGSMLRNWISISKNYYLHHLRTSLHFVPSHQTHSILEDPIIAVQAKKARTNKERMDCPVLLQQQCSVH